MSFKSDEESSSVITSETSQIVTGGGTIKVNSADNILQGEKVTLIKINMLFGAKEIVEGMKNTLQRHKSKLVMPIGFDESMLTDIPPLIKKFSPEYKLYLRFAGAMSARLILIAV